MYIQRFSLFLYYLGKRLFCKKSNTPVGWARRLAERVLRMDRTAGDASDCDLSFLATARLVRLRHPLSP